MGPSSRHVAFRLAQIRAAAASQAKPRKKAKEGREGQLDTGFPPARRTRGWLGTEPSFSAQRIDPRRPVIRLPSHMIDAAIGADVAFDAATDSDRANLERCGDDANRSKDEPEHARGHWLPAAIGWHVGAGHRPSIAAARSIRPSTRRAGGIKGARRRRRRISCRSTRPQMRERRRRLQR